MSDTDTGLPTPRGTGAASLCDPASLPIDFTALAQLSGGDRTVESKMLSAFRKSNDADGAALAEAIRRQDFAAVVQVSHRLLGAGRIAGAKNLACVCEAVEAAALSGDWSGVVANSGACYRELERIRAYLRKLDGSQTPIL